MGVDPLLLDIPQVIESERLLMRPPQPGDGRAMNEAIFESFAMLEQWMAWARHLPSLEDSERLARRKAADWILREELMILIFDKGQNSLVGCTGLHRIDWQVRRFEIGYWVRKSCEGRGFIKEATCALTQFAFRALGARRVEIRCDSRNVRSAKIPQCLGYRLEAVLQNEALDARGEKLRDTMLFARVDTDGLPDVGAFW